MGASGKTVGSTHRVTRNPRLLARALPSPATAPGSPLTSPVALMMPSRRNSSMTGRSASQG